jgi:hypothetical protein
MSNHKHFIYALVDPFTREVKYVGLTRKGLIERMEHHLHAARRNVNRPVYDWIRSILPAVPIMVKLQEVDNTWSSKDKSPAATAEFKWMKRFRRTILNYIDTSSRAYRELVNIKETKSVLRSRRAKALAR